VAEPTIQKKILPPFFRSVLRLLVNAMGPGSLTLLTLMIEAICYSETSVIRTAKRRHIPEGIVLLLGPFSLVSDGYACIRSTLDIAAGNSQVIGCYHPDTCEHSEVIRAKGLYGDLIYI
jgi:hypothetical protein